MILGTTHSIAMRFLNYRGYRGSGLRHSCIDPTPFHEIFRDKIGIYRWFYMSQHVVSVDMG